MKLRPDLLAAVVTTGILLATVACGSDAATPPRASDQSATPDVLATLTAQIQGVEVGTPTPTAVPAAARAVALEFAAGHAAISDDWDRLHIDFDGWREGLVACTASSVQSALQGFAGRFGEITDSAREISRPAVVRELADTLIQAAEEEEEALRHLRDTWQPGELVVTQATAQADPEGQAEDGELSQAPIAASPFERVKIARASSSVLRRQVADFLDDRAARSSPLSLEKVTAFSDLFEELDSSWDLFHLDYDTFRGQSAELDPGETLSRLGMLVDQFRGVVAAIRGLPTAEATQGVAQILAETAEAEDLALRRLRGTFRKSDPSAEDAPAGELGDGAGEDAENPEANGEDAENPEANTEAAIEANDPTLFDAFDAQIVMSDSARLVARQQLDRVLDDVSEATQAVVEDFTTQHVLLIQDWKVFHDDYDQWRRTEGGCDRSKAGETLGQFAFDFGRIADKVRGLPAATVLRPLGEILVEASEREESALRGLRDSWRPHDADVYQSLDRERSAASKLRRQVSVGIQELMERFGISP